MFNYYVLFLMFDLVYIYIYMCVCVTCVLFPGFICLDCLLCTCLTGWSWICFLWGPTFNSELCMPFLLGWCWWWLGKSAWNPHWSNPHVIELPLIHWPRPNGSLLGNAWHCSHCWHGCVKAVRLPQTAGKCPIPEWDDGKPMEKLEEQA